MRPALMRFAPTGCALALDRKAWGQEFQIAIVEGPHVRAPFELDEELAVVDVRGPLVHHAHPLWDSYESIQARVLAANDCAESRAVCLRIDSPGGDVDGCFDLARWIRSQRQRSGKPHFAFVDGLAASAAYALACATDWVIVPDTALVGSIGVIEGLRDQVTADRMMGLAYYFASSGARKADGNPHVPITEEAAAALQSHVDGLAEVFFALVADFRGMPLEEVRGLEAGVRFGAQAVAAGLADEVGSWTTAQNRLRLSATAQAGTAQAGRGEHMPPKDEKEEKDGKSNPFASIVASLLEMADGDDEASSKRARRMLKAIEEGESDDAKPEKENKGEAARAEGESEGEGEAGGEGRRAARAEGEGEGEAARAAALVGAGKVGEVDVLALVRDVHTIKAERAEEIHTRDVKALLDTRPDFDAMVRATLATLPIAKVREAVEKWPKRRAAPAAAASATPTVQGETQGDFEAPVTSEEDAFIDRKMGANRMIQGPVINAAAPRTMLGSGDRAMARAHLKAQETRAK